jgi:hypothetical protein
MSAPSSTNAAPRAAQDAAAAVSPPAAPPPAAAELPLFKLAQLKACGPKVVRAYLAEGEERFLLRQVCNQGFDVDAAHRLATRADGPPARATSWCGASHSASWPAS